MTDIQQAIIEELSMRTTKLADDLYICVSATSFREYSQKPNELSVYIAPAEGGAWQFVGLVTVNEDHATFMLVTVYGIVRCTGVKETRLFEYCDPDIFPQTLKELIIIAAHNANKAYALKQKRSWSRYDRRNR